MRFRPGSLILTLLLLNLHAVAQQIKKPVAKPVTAAIPVPAVKIKNNIHLTSKSLKVAEAYLLFDDASSVPPDNQVALNQRVNMILVIKSGWAERNGRVFPGGSEVIKTADGKVVLNSDDLFKAYEETGVSTEDAAYITLKAIITKMDTKNSSVTVSFRVWDKKGVGEITGSYKLLVK